MVASECRNSGILSLACVLFLVSISAVSQKPSPSQVLTVLKARDAQFDNYTLSYKRTELITLKDPALVLAPDDAALDNPRLKEFVGKEVLRTYGEEIVVRDLDITITAHLDPETAAFYRDVPVGIGIPAPYTFKSNTEAKQRYYSGEDPNGLIAPPSHSGIMNQLMIYPSDAGQDTTQEKLTETEFALGIGYGKRLVSIERVEQTEDGLEIWGEMLVWVTDVTTAHLVMDKNYVVRKAEITALSSDGGTNLIHIETDGSARAGNLNVAAHGHFLRTAYLNATPDTPHTTIEDYDVSFDSARFNLSDVEYADLVSLEPPDGTFIDDRIAQLTFAKGYPDSIRPYNAPKSTVLAAQRATVNPSQPESPSTSLAAVAPATASEQRPSDPNRDSVPTNEGKEFGQWPLILGTGAALFLGVVILVSAVRRRHQ